MHLFSSPMRISTRISPRFAMTAALLAVALTFGLTGCKSKQEQALEQAKKQAAATGQPQTITSTDSSGNTVTTTVQPPLPGQTEEAVTTTVTPKPAAATSAPSSGQAAAAAPASGITPAPEASQPAPQPPPPPPSIHVPAGTNLVIRVDQRLSAKGSRAGDRFTGEVVEPVLDEKSLPAIPKGTRVSGRVVEAKKRGHFKGAASLELRLTSLTLNGTEYPLETRALQERKKGKGKRSAAMIGGGTGLGMLIGGVASGGSGLLIGGLAGAGAGTAGAGLTGNRDLVIPAESIVHFKLSDELVLQP